MSVPLECVGATRDLGLDQGSACRGPLRDALARSGVRARWRPWHGFLARPARGDGRDARLANEVLRHYPQLAERWEGLARGAGLPRAALLELLARAPTPGALDARVVGGGEERARLHAQLEAPDHPGAAWLVRRSQPEVGFRSLELTLPWLASAVAGVNEEGLAVVCVRADRRDADAGAPPVLLVQECLQRFRTLEPAVEWCLHRPAGAGARLVLLDAAGGSASLELGGGPARVRGSAPGGPLPGLGAEASWQATLDPAARRLELVRGPRARRESTSL